MHWARFTSGRTSQEKHPQWPDRFGYQFKLRWGNSTVTPTLYTTPLPNLFTFRFGILCFAFETSKKAFGLMLHRGRAEGGMERGKKGRGGRERGREKEKQKEERMKGGIE